MRGAFQPPRLVNGDNNRMVNWRLDLLNGKNWKSCAACVTQTIGGKWIVHRDIDYPASLELFAAVGSPVTFLQMCAINVQISLVFLRLVDCKIAGHFRNSRLLHNS